MDQSRRDAMRKVIGLPAALTAMGVSAVAEAKPAAEDIVVISSPDYLSSDHVEHIRAEWERNFPDTRALVLGGGMTLQVHRGVARVMTPGDSEGR
jgi:hypothetical protein